MTELQKIWLRNLYLEAAEQHKGAAVNEHIWALGSETPEQAADHEYYAKENREFAIMLKEMAEEV